MWHWVRTFERVKGWGFPGGPAFDSAFTLQGAWVLSLVGELKSQKPSGSKNDKEEDEGLSHSGV